MGVTTSLNEAAPLAPIVQLSPCAVTVMSSDVASTTRHSYSTPSAMTDGTAKNVTSLPVKMTASAPCTGRVDVTENANSALVTDTSTLSPPPAISMSNSSGLSSLKVRSTR